MSNFLAQMSESSAARAAAVTRSFTSGDLDRPAYPLRLSGFDLIAEIKDRSPAEGELAGIESDRNDRAARYVDGGAAAISVLTEPDRFDGALSHLEEVVAAVSPNKVPVMRKDFLVQPVQVLEAKAAGASGILLIAAMLDDGELTSMLDCAFEHDLFVLLESFDEIDLERTVHVLRRVKYREQAARKKFLVGVNTRNLRTLSVDPVRLLNFGPKLPQDVVCVAESGQHTAGDAANVADWGYDMALVGTALMRAADPAVLIREMLDAGRGK
jgi:indole-3-glycerol phosphate synthase